jgi:hypothetical protein
LCKKVLFFVTFPDFVACTSDFSWFNRTSRIGITKNLWKMSHTHTHTHTFSLSLTHRRHIGTRMHERTFIAVFLFLSSVSSFFYSFCIPCAFCTSLFFGIFVNSPFVCILFLCLYLWVSNVLCFSLILLFLTPGLCDGHFSGWI